MTRWLLAALMVPAASHAADLDSAVSLRGDLWSGDRDLNEEQAVAATTLWFRGRADFESSGQIVANAWISVNTHDESNSGRELPVYRLRELYWSRSFGNVSVKAGRLMPAWGRADGFNPTDNLSPRDFTSLVPEDADQRFGNEGVGVEMPISKGTFSVHWFDDAASHRVPLETVEGVHYRFQRSSRRSQWAAKWEAAGEGVDGSLSYFDGHSLLPDLSPAGVGPNGFEVAVGGHRTRIFGGDISLARGAMVWRAEAAWSNFTDSSAVELFRKKSQFWSVAGGERQLDNGLTVGLQLTVRHVFGHRNLSELPDSPLRTLARRQASLSNQVERNQYGLIWRIAKSLRNETIALETNGAVLFPGDGGLVRVKAGYTINDRLSFLAGFDYYFGRRVGFFGQLADNSLIFTQLRYAF